MSDEDAQSHGFDDAGDFFKMVSGADISTPDKLAAFKIWQESDGSKAGLILLTGES